MPATTQIYPRVTSVNVGTAQAVVLGANPSRNGLILCNNHATQTISIAPGSVPGIADPTITSLGAGTILIAALTIVRFDLWPWTASVIAIASGATTPLGIIEF